MITNATELVQSPEAAAEVSTVMLDIFNQEDQATLDFLYDVYLSFYNFSAAEARRARMLLTTQPSFQGNLRNVADYNVDSSTSDWLKVNKYAGTSAEEFSDKFTASPSAAPPPPKKKRSARRALSSTLTPAVTSSGAVQSRRMQKQSTRRLLNTPKPMSPPPLRAPSPSLDWRSEGIVPLAKSDDGCGASWVSASTAAIEAAVLLQYDQLQPQDVLLSRQMILACAKNGSYADVVSENGYSSTGCDGGLTYEVGDFAFEFGIPLESEYEYQVGDSNCPGSIFWYVASGSFANMVVAAEPTATVAYEGRSALALMQALQSGPIVVLWDLTGNQFRFYGGGVYDSTECSDTSYNHALLLVGYEFNGTVQNPDGYWIARNSWGSSWGVYGDIQIRMQPEGTTGMCGMYRFAYAPPRQFKQVPGLD